jgi:hypothetical protein
MATRGRLISSMPFQSSTAESDCARLPARTRSKPPSVSGARLTSELSVAKYGHQLDRTALATFLALMLWAEATEAIQEFGAMVKCGYGTRSGSKLLVVRRTIDRPCAVFHPEVDFSDEGQGGIRSLGPEHVGRLRAWLPQCACQPAARQGDGFAVRFCSTRRSQRADRAAPRAGLGPTCHQRTGAIGKGWFARRKTLSKRFQAQG